MKNLTFDSYLSEMPHVEYGNDKIFDLELEKFSKNPKGLLDYLERILSGKKLTDKYGQTIELKSLSDQSMFMTNLKADPFFSMWMRKYHLSAKLEAIFKKHGIDALVRRKEFENDLLKNPMRD